VIETEK